MKTGRKWLRMLMPLMAVTFLGLAQNSFAQDDYQGDNSGNYDNSDEAMVQPENDVDYNTFHEQLSSYGSWRDYPGYGNVWVCNVSGFRPYYSGGHWAYTRFGWTWVSDYDWGWGPFHYGRWGYDASFGYFWVPGYTWGPAWVSWRNGGDYYGWAPLSPGLNVSVNVGVGIGAASWVFMPHRYMGYRSINSYYVPRERNVTIIRNTTIINNTNVYNNNRYVVGPERRQVERYTGQRVQEQNIYVSNNRNVNRQDRNGIHLYNPNGGNRSAVSRGNNTQPINRQDNVRQQPVGRPVQNGVQQQPNSTPADNNRTDRFQQSRIEKMQQRQQAEQNRNNQQQDNQRQQQIQDRAQQQNNDQRRQQLEQQRQQQMDNQQRQQQMNDRQQQMQQRQQQQDAQRQQQMQQRQEQMQQQRQQQTQERQQQMQQQRQQQMQQQRQQQMQQQRNQNADRPATQGGSGGRRKNG